MPDEDPNKTPPRDINMTLEDRNKWKRKIVEKNHDIAQNIDIDIKARSQLITLGATSLAFRTPFRLVISGPTLRYITFIPN
jgi:hypothetical protein